MTEDKKKYSWSDLKNPIEAKAAQKFDVFVSFVENLLGRKYKILNPGKPCIIWVLDFIDINNEICRKAALRKLAMDCGIPNGRIEDITNQAVYEFAGYQLIALMNPDCLSEEDKRVHAKSFRYLK